MTESWKAIPGYEGLYEVSSLGRIQSLERKVRFGKHWRIVPTKMLVFCNDGKGYSLVHLYKNNKPVLKKVHHLVLLAFHGPCPSEMECRHFPDQNEANNYVINISWDTREKNMQDKIANGTAQRGERSHFAKLTKDIVRQIFFAAGTHKEIATRCGISRQQVGRIKQGENWSHLNLRK